jgi:polyisoprenyl-phosphate glycosyltransferase
VTKVGGTLRVPLTWMSNRHTECADYIKENDLMSASPLLSIVCPAFKEEEVLPLFHRELCGVLAHLQENLHVEILYVDDGSPDGTLQVMKTLAAQDPRVRFFSLSRNFGKEAALLAGLEHARGDIVITLDSDLQHPPALIPALLQKWREGHEVVVTTKEEDKRLGPLKRLSSRVFYQWMGRFSKLQFADAIADYCLLTRKAVDGLLRMREGHRLMRGLIQWLGFATAKVQFLPAERPAGQTKDSLLRLLALASDGMFSFSRAPLRIATYLGLVALTIGLGHAAWLVIQLASGSAVSLAWSYLLMATHFLGGAILCCLGILGEYVGRVFEQVKDRPVYLLKEQSNEVDGEVAVPSRRDAA